MLQRCCDVCCSLDKPDAPENLAVKECTEDSVTLSWAVPPSDGGAPITRYVVERREPSKRAWVEAGNTPADRLELTVNGLVKGQAYSFRVAAENSCGVGEFTEMQKPVSPRSQFGQLVVLLRRLACLISYDDDDYNDMTMTVMTMTMTMTRV